MRKIFLLAVAVLTSLAITGCGASSTTPTTPDKPAPVEKPEPAKPDPATETK